MTRHGGPTDVSAADSGCKRIAEDGTRLLGGIRYARGYRASYGG